MRPIGGTLRSYAELARLSNLPTVLSNVLVGVSLVRAETAPPHALSIATIAAAMALLYVAGMALNDAVDARLDAAERPARPIPSGRISRQAATIFAAICMFAALAIMARHGRGALALTAALIAAIVIYDLAHKRFAGAVVLMGLCRSLAYLTASAAIAWPLDWTLAAPVAGAILLYIVLLTVIARVETRDRSGGRAWLAMILPLPALAVIVVSPPSEFLVPLVCGGLLLAWLAFASFNLVRRPPRIRAAVQGWLAGICLVDAWFLALLDRPWLILISVACFALTLLGHRFIMGT